MPKPKPKCKATAHHPTNRQCVCTWTEAKPAAIPSALLIETQAKTEEPPPCPHDELETVWNLEVANAYILLKPQHQEFLLGYIRTGNAADSYRKAYNPLATDHIASVSGSRLLATVGISSILLKFAERRTEALFVASNIYFEMAKASKPEWVEKDGTYENVGDVPDWNSRDRAAAGLAKIYALAAPEKVTAEVKHTHNGSVNFTFDTTELKELLNGPAGQ